MSRLPPAVSFDFTGTLATSPRLGAVYSRVLARHGVEVEAERIAGLARQVWWELDCANPSGADRFGRHPRGARGWWAAYLERLCQHLGVPSPGPFAAAELFERFARADAWAVYPDVRPALRQLVERGHRLALISNWDERLPRLLAELELASSFSVVVYSQQVGAEKPAAGIFHWALEELELPAAEVVHVGDSRRLDVEGARALGMKALLLDRTGQGGDLHDLRSLL